jgi:hypothetical protein
VSAPSPRLDEQEEHEDLAAVWNVIDNIPEGNLDSWYRWLTIFAIGVPILGAIAGGVCGWAAFIVSERIGNLQTVTVRQAKEDANTAKLALGKYRAPRILTAEQQNTIIDTLKPFAGQKYSLSVAAGNEPEALLCVLDAILQRAGWIQHPMIGSVAVGTPCGMAALNSLSAIDARRGPNATRATIAAINALVEALAPTDAAARGATDPINNSTEDVIILMVGAKP